MPYHFKLQLINTSRLAGHDRYRVAQLTGFQDTAGGQGSLAHKSPCPQLSGARPLAATGRAEASLAYLDTSRALAGSIWVLPWPIKAQSATCSHGIVGVSGGGQLGDSCTRAV
jgi:hypothetical protein